MTQTRPRRHALEVVTAKITKNRIKATLRERGMTQEEAARRVGVSYRQMNRLALGHSDPSLLLAAKIAVVLNEPLDTLFPIKITTRERLNRPRPQHRCLRACHPARPGRRQPAPHPRTR